MQTMTKRQGKSGTIDVKALLREDEEFLRALVRTALQEVLEAEMTEALGAEKGERTAERQGYRSGYYGRTLITRIGKLELRVPQDRTGRFSTELFERYQRSERALVAALAEMYVQGVSTRKVKAITEELCGHSAIFFILPPKKGRGDEFDRLCAARFARFRTRLLTRFRAVRAQIRALGAP
jgi:putative transposase